MTPRLVCSPRGPGQQKSPEARWSPRQGGPEAARQSFGRPREANGALMGMAGARGGSAQMPLMGEEVGGGAAP